MHSQSELLAELPERLHLILDRHCGELNSLPALYERDRVLSYDQLRDASVELAQQFTTDGIRAGDRVMLVAENCCLLVAAMLALSRLDAWAVVINARLSAAEIESIRQHCAPRRMLFSSAISTEAAQHAVQANAEPREQPQLGSYHMGPINPDCHPEPVYADSARQVAAMIYTTGTTGTPKGVMLTHRNLLFVARMGSYMRQLTRADRIYGVLPISHVFGLSSVCFATLYSGAVLQLEARFDALEVIRALREDRISILLGVPAMFSRLLAVTDQLDLQLRAPALRFMYAGGAPLDLTLKKAVEQRFHSALHNGYGMTESSPTISQTRIDEQRDDTSVGKPIPGVEVQLLDSQRTARVAQGEVGELWVRGPNVMKGYYRAADQTAEVINAGGWLNTGDLARQDRDGALFIVGRSKELIIRSGFNVYPPEVEAVLSAFPGVVLSAVVGRVAENNEEVIAFIQVSSPDSFDCEALQIFLAEQLAPYKRPSQIHIHAALPATASGKILKHELKTLATRLQ